ncbi:MAG TPA: hypothetical protein VMM59_02695 [Thermohalobaculum sp.]|nr:hypothetical protein [Thermohalobaculum sp.]
MPGVVEPAEAEVEAAEEGDSVVDRHDLLVLRGAERVLVVDREAQARMGEPVEARLLQPLAVGGVEDGRVPVEHPDLEVLAPPRQVLEKRAERVRHARHGAFGKLEQHAAVHVPADDQDRAARAQGGRLEGAEIGGGIDEERQPPGAHGAPAVAALGDDRAGGSCGLALVLVHPVSGPSRADRSRRPAGAMRPAA